MVVKKKSNLFKTMFDVVGFLLLSIFYVAQSIYNYCLPKKLLPLKDIEDEVVLVTGGGGGLGRLLALRLANLGATVVLWDVNYKAVEETAELVKGVGGTVYTYQCDLCDKDDVYRVAEKTRQDVGDVTILINNAGVVSGNLILDTPDHLIKRTFDVNILAHFWTVKAFLPNMIKNNNGHIVTIASMAGHVGINKLVDYCSSKFAAVGFGEALRVELEAQGITSVKTTVVCPYFIQSTGMFDNVNSRFLPTLKSNDVADRTIEGIRREEVVVLMPVVFSIGLVLKAMMPWSIVSMFLRALVPDAAPHAESKSTAGGSIAFKDMQKMNPISKTVTVLNQQRVLATGKNL